MKSIAIACAVLLSACATSPAPRNAAFFNTGIHRYVGGLARADPAEQRLRSTLVTIGGASTAPSSSWTAASARCTRS